MRFLGRISRAIKSCWLPVTSIPHCSHSSCGRMSTKCNGRLDNLRLNFCFLHNLKLDRISQRINRISKPINRINRASELALCAVWCARDTMNRLEWQPLQSTLQFPAICLQALHLLHFQLCNLRTPISHLQTLNLRVLHHKLQTPQTLPLLLDSPIRSRSTSRRVQSQSGKALCCTISKDGSAWAEELSGSRVQITRNDFGFSKFFYLFFSHHGTCFDH